MSTIFKTMKYVEIIGKYTIFKTKGTYVQHTNDPRRRIDPTCTAVND